MDTSTSHKKRTYIVVGVVFVILLVVALVLFRYPNKSEAAHEKARQLISAYELAGLTPPSEQQIVGTYGDDGGNHCRVEFKELLERNLNQLLANGAAQVGARGVIVDARVLKGEALVLGVYCPDRLPEYEAFVNELKTADLIRE